MNENLELLCNWAMDWLISYNPEKTEAMLFTMKDNQVINLKFDDCKVKTVEFHKHLGLTFSSNGGWHNHIENIVKKTSRMIGSFRKLKFLLNRTTLSKIYTVFIRPHFEYACEVWDGCSIEQSTKPEKLQLAAARIVTGLPRYASSRSLYFETG